jgi:hypothetical protein
LDASKTCCRRESSSFPVARSAWYSGGKCRRGGVRHGLVGLLLDHVEVVVVFLVGGNSSMG